MVLPEVSVRVFAGRNSRRVPVLLSPGVESAEPRVAGAAFVRRDLWKVAGPGLRSSVCVALPSGALSAVSADREQAVRVRQVWPADDPLHPAVVEMRRQVQAHALLRHSQLRIRLPPQRPMPAVRPKERRELRVRESEDGAQLRRRDVGLRQALQQAVRLRPA